MAFCKNANQQIDSQDYKLLQYSKKWFNFWFFRVLGLLGHPEVVVRRSHRIQASQEVAPWGQRQIPSLQAHKANHLGILGLRLPTTLTTDRGLLCIQVQTTFCNRVPFFFEGWPIWSNTLHPGVVNLLPLLLIELHNTLNTCQNVENGMTHKVVSYFFVS